ncbi:hypothetical protein BGW37DRAFT_518344 [Umbelopsis sp. PMI_123]|nr:hypothetical protein BGW37DRAFT_518344 [Umbelopsis sp. PMI_123]
MVARQAGRTHTFYFLHPTTNKPIAFDRANQPLLERRYKQLNDPDIWHTSHRGLSDRAHILVQDSYWPNSDAVTVDFHRMCVHAPSESGGMEKYRICRVKLDWDQEDMIKALQEQTPRDSMIREHRDRMMLMDMDRDSPIDGVIQPSQGSSSYPTSLGLTQVNPEQISAEERENAQSPLPTRRSSTMYGIARRRSMLLAAGLGSPENMLMHRRHSQQALSNASDAGSSSSSGSTTSNNITAPSASDSEPVTYRSVRIDDDAAVQVLVSRMRRAHHQRNSLAQMQRQNLRQSSSSNSSSVSNIPIMSPSLQQSESVPSTLWHRRLSLAAGNPPSSSSMRQYMDRRVSSPNNSAIRNMIMNELAAVQQQLHTPPLVSSPQLHSETDHGATTTQPDATRILEDVPPFHSGEDSTLSD